MLSDIHGNLPALEAVLASPSDAEAVAAFRAIVSDQQARPAP